MLQCIAVSTGARNAKMLEHFSKMLEPEIPKCWREKKLLARCDICAEEKRHVCGNSDRCVWKLYVYALQRTYTSALFGEVGSWGRVPFSRI